MHKKSNLKPITYYILFFFLLSAFGWLWEVLLYFITEQQFINRGALTGPWLPIYGSGGLLLLLLLASSKGHPVRIFLLSAVLCSVLEYLTSFILERAWGIRWWDYSSHFFNINGRICLFGSIGFGLGGLLIIYLLHPLCTKAYNRLPGRWRVILCILLLLLFIPDCIYALFSPRVGSGITTWHSPRFYLL